MKVIIRPEHQRNRTLCVSVESGGCQKPLNSKDHEGNNLCIKEERGKGKTHTKDSKTKDTIVDL